MNTHLNYFPLTPGFIVILALVLAGISLLVLLGILRVAPRLGLSPYLILALLLASLLGSYINIPVAYLPERTVIVNREIHDFGYRFVMPELVDWPGTVIAVNVGGALIPVLLSLFLLAKHRLWLEGVTATAAVAAIAHMVAFPVPGVGIAMPFIVPPLATVLVALAVSWRRAAPLAYISGCLGTLIGADLLNLPSIGRLGAPVASIGGAGTFDGVFLTGVAAVLLASLFHEPERNKPAG